MAGKFENIEKVIDTLDWHKLLKDYLLEDQYKHQIFIWHDGTISDLDSGTYIRTENECVILTTPGYGNVDESRWAEGWAEKIDDEDPDAAEHYGKWRDTDSGKIMTGKEMVGTAIDEGDVTTEIEDLKEKLRRQYYDDYVLNR